MNDKIKIATEKLVETIEIINRDYYKNELKILRDRNRKLEDEIYSLESKNDRLSDKIDRFEEEIEELVDNKPKNLYEVFKRELVEKFYKKYNQNELEEMEKIYIKFKNDRNRKS